MNTSEGKLTAKQIAAYHRDGFVILPGLFDWTEIELLGRSAREDRTLDQHSVKRDDGTGAEVRLSLWNHPGEGIYGMFARCRKLVDSVEQLLEDEVYHYHSKMIMKDAHHPRYTPLKKVDDAMIKIVGISRFEDEPSDVAWLEDSSDKSARSLGATKKHDA